MIDVPSQTVRTPRGAEFRFDIDPFRKDCLIKGLDEIGLTLKHSAEIEAFEAKHKTAQPWLFV